ncbi:MAG: hypothetical protein IKQ22_00665 [Clostridia bacterium]|nr:hypothetical protein [Clostridia bacterium]
MSTFTQSNFPNMPPVTGMTTAAITQLADAYVAAKNAFESHANSEVGNDGADPHKIIEYIEQMENKAGSKASKAKNEADMLNAMLAGGNTNPAVTSAQYMINQLGNDPKDLILFIKSLIDRVSSLEEQLNTLSLLQFDNVPVGAGIRWWKDTLPEDGTYVWANGQTLYGVNQNFPELARVWETGSSDNVKVPKEDHTIFKVRKATVEIKPIEHAYIAAANGEETPGDGD